MLPPRKQCIQNCYPYRRVMLRAGKPMLGIILLAALGIDLLQERFTPPFRLGSGAILFPTINKLSSSLGSPTRSPPRIKVQLIGKLQLAGNAHDDSTFIDMDLPWLGQSQVTSINESLSFLPHMRLPTESMHGKDMQSLRTTMRIRTYQSA
jgi:hypothetical protein